MPTALFGILAGLAAATSFGAGDLAGGLAARRAGGLAAAAGAQAVGLLLLVAALAPLRPSVPDASSLLIGLAAGVAGGLGLASLYAALAIGAMGLVAALSALGSVLIPVLVGSLTGTLLSPLQLGGVAMAAVAAATAGGALRDGVSRAALLLAAVAAVAFGSWYVLLDVAADAGEPLWALVASRSMSTVLLGGLVAAQRTGGGLPGVLGAVVLAGVLDVGGNVLFVTSRGAIPVGLAAALTGLHPLVTMLLARALLGERLPRLGMAAVVLAIIAVALISLG